MTLANRVWNTSGLVGCQNAPLHTYFAPLMPSAAFRPPAGKTMPEFDPDLLSIQEARHMAVAARDAQRQFSKASQAEVDRICAAMAEAAYANAERLGRMATEETGYGVPEHKTLKNTLTSKILWEAIKDLPTVGV